MTTAKSKKTDPAASADANDKPKASVRRVPKAPPAEPPARPSKTAAEVALKEAFASNRRTALTRDMWLKSQRPFAVEVELPVRGALVLMKRIELLDLVREGGEHWPLRNRLVAIVQNGGLKERDLDDDKMLETLRVARAVAKATIIVPPPEWVAACDADYETAEDAKAAREAVLMGLRRTDLRPQFVDVGEPCEDDQLVLAGGEGDAAGVGYSDADVDEPVVVHAEDLLRILASAYLYGPGALGRRFRGEREPKARLVGAVQKLAQQLKGAKPAA